MKTFILFILLLTAVSCKCSEFYKQNVADCKKTCEQLNGEFSQITCESSNRHTCQGYSCWCIKDETPVRAW